MSNPLNDADGVELHGQINIKQLAELLGLESSDTTLLANFIRKHKTGQRPTYQEVGAAAKAFVGLVDADQEITNKATIMLKRVDAEKNHLPQESVNEGIRIAKEGIEECWDDMGGQEMTTNEQGEQMSVTISMPGKNISVTTDSAEEIGNILRLAGINIGGGTAGDVDGDGDHDLGDHAAELSLPGAGGEEPVIYVGAGEGGGGEQEYADQPSDSPLTTNAGNTAGEEASSDDEEEKDETKEATQTPKSWEDMSGNEHPGTSVKGDRYGNQADKEDEDKPTSMYKKNAIIDKEVDESFEELDEDDLDENAYTHAAAARILQLAGITNEAQSAAQKAAFKAMIAKKNGNKSDAKADDKDDNKKPDADGDGIPDWVKGEKVKEEAPAGNSIYGQSVYEAGTESARILALAGIEESKLMNSPANTSMPEPKTYDSLPSRTGQAGGNKDYGLNRADGQGENPMGMHTLDVNKSVDESFAAAMGEYRKFVAENISRKK